MNRPRAASSWIGAVVLGVACTLLGQGAGTAADNKGSSLPPADYVRLVEPSVKVTVDALGGEVTRRSAEKARVAMVMLAAFAQYDLSGTDGAQRATLRDAALDTAARIKDKKYAEAVTQAKGLTKVAANPQARKEKVKLLGPVVDVDELMSQFRAPDKGGLDIENLFDKLAGVADGQLPAAALNDDLRLTAYRTAVAAELCKEHTPPQKAPLWQKLSDEMRLQAVRLAEAVQAKDGKAAFQAVEKLNASCNHCHREFR
ncbi:MAG: cytochrome c [Planctomycetia bacterium]|nr:cytochrome c [Planctomycetia bacterium]